MKVNQPHLFVPAFTRREPDNPHLEAIQGRGGGAYFHTIVQSALHMQARMYKYYIDYSSQGEVHISAQIPTILFFTIVQIGCSTQAYTNIILNIQ